MLQNFQFKLLLLFSSLILFSCASKTPSPEFAKWASLKTPTTGETHIYGTYQAGCISGAEALPVDGQGYSVVRRSRVRYYGHPTLVTYLTELSKKSNQKKYPREI